MKPIKENLPVIVAIATAVAALTANLFGVNEKIVFSGIVLVVILILALSNWLKSYTTPDVEQKPLYTLATNTLLPNKTKQFLGLRTNLVVIGDKDHPEVFENLRRGLRSIDDDLVITDFLTDSLDKDLQRGKLLDVLSRADAVVLVRTMQLEKQPWIYAVVDDWAYRNSNVPVLVIDKIEAEGVPLKLSDIPEKFYFIPDHQASLSWRLLKRANERSLAWRNQASFNRSIFFALVILGLAGLLSAYMTTVRQRNSYEALLAEASHREEELVQRQRHEKYEQLQELFTVEARHTKDDYQTLMKSNDETLNVSYWISYQGTYYPLSSSENGAHRSWRASEQSIIGCVLAGPNRTVQWDESMSRPRVLSFTGETIPEENNCGYGKQGQRKLKSMVCASYSDVQDPGHDDMVGVCIFTENEKNNLSKQPTDFIKKRAKEFHESVKSLIRNKQLVPQ